MISLWMSRYWPRPCPAARPSPFVFSPARGRRVTVTVWMKNVKSHRLTRHISLYSPLRWTFAHSVPTCIIRHLSVCDCISISQMSDYIALLRLPYWFLSISNDFRLQCVCLSLDFIFFFSPHFLNGDDPQQKTYNTQVFIQLCLQQSIRSSRKLC